MYWIELILGLLPLVVFAGLIWLVVDRFKY
jgi:hypothetical protein